MKVKSILFTGLIAFIMAACGDSVNVTQDPVGENCSGCREIIIDATCTTAGEITKTCTIDTSHAGTQVIDPLGHDNGAWHSTAKNCDELGYSVLLCTRCEHVLVTIPTLSYGHDWKSWTVITAPTCTIAGKQTRSCAVDPSHTETQVLDPLGHDSGEWHSTSVNCDELGTSELRCTRCDHVLGTSLALALGHSWGAWAETTAPSCSTAGVETRICSRDNSHTETQIIDPVGHDSGAWHSTAEGTCTEYGTKELHCTRCNSVIGTDPTLVLGHSYGIWITTTLPTCTEPGEQTRTCSVDSSHTETQVLNPLGHDSGEWYSTAATCTEDGPSELLCTRCSHVLDTNPTPAPGHKWGSWIVTTAATCSKKGVETRICAVDPSHTDTQEIAIVSTAHNWGSWMESTAPTCTTAGVNKRTCSHNTAHTQTQPGAAALGHDWSGSWSMEGNLYKICQRSGCTEKLTINFEMVQIEAGTFTMGSPESEPGRALNETQHQVTLTKGFYIGKYEVTQEQYEAVMGTNPSYFHGGSGREPAAGEVQGKRPVERVSWYDAIVFCNKLSIMEGLTPVYSISGSTDTTAWGDVPTDSDATWDAVEMVSGANGYRLPTEAEWEYACRAGTTTAYSFGDSDTQLGDYAWYTPNSGSMTHEVGKKLPNAWGLYDMHGNVYDWCWDWHGSYGSGAKTDPVGAVSGSYRAMRGGNWRNNSDLRSANRVGTYSPNYSSGSLSFRVVRQ